MAEPTIIDTHSFPQPVQVAGPWTGPVRRVRDILPDHEVPLGLPPGTENALPLGGVLPLTRVVPGARFPGIGQTPWVPPDPTIAVGPAHIVTTVNMAIAFYTKDGTLLFSARLDSTGNPGFFEDVGGGTFTFDPKCLYDPVAGRFVVLALEVYGDTQEAYVTIAVSDDSDPQGVWYKYRTDAVISDGSTTFWWDYPGLGFDAQAYYVNANLFGLNQPGWGGVGYRVFDKAPMLSGQPAVYATLRDPGSASAQAAQHYGTNPAAFFVSVASSSSIRVQAIRNPLTSPQLVTTDLSVPSFSGPRSAAAPDADRVSTVDWRIFNAHWRDGQLYAAHNVRKAEGAVARWYHFDTADWPDAGGVTLVESGEIDPGPGLYSFFPAIASNAAGDVAVVMGTSGLYNNVAIALSGRAAGDPAGTVSQPAETLVATVAGGGRWGDYYDITVDPTDDTTFWYIGEFPDTFGWNTWIGSFTVTPQADGPVAVRDGEPVVYQGQSRTIDVLANDGHTTPGTPVQIVWFDPVSTHGGLVSMSVGTGPGGRNELVYHAPTGYSGPDTFGYTIGDDGGQTASTTVSVYVGDPADFADPVTGVFVADRLPVRYYALSNPDSLPDFSTLTPYAEGSVRRINFASSNGEFAGSGRSDDVGAVFEGLLVVPQDDIYSLFLTSDDGSKLFIHDELVIDNDGLHAMRQRSARVKLKAGPHPLRIEFFEAGGRAGLTLHVAGGGSDRQIVPAAWFGHGLCAPDVNEDGQVDLSDLTALLANFGTPDAGFAGGDVNRDGRVDLADLSILLSFFGTTCP